MKPEIEIKPAKASQYPYQLLEMADPSRGIIDGYLEKGTCFVASLQEKEIGVIVVQVHGEHLEIMNLAIAPEFRRRGYARTLLRFVSNYYAHSPYKSLRIATGNSSLGPLRLYQLEGFDLLELKRNYFLEKYPEPIFEDGIQCKHLLVLEKELPGSEGSGLV